MSLHDRAGARADGDWVQARAVLLLRAKQKCCRVTRATRRVGQRNLLEADEDEADELGDPVPVDVPVGTDDGVAVEVGVPEGDAVGDGVPVRALVGKLRWHGCGSPPPLTQWH